jgi:hypothetical protein
MGAIGLDLGNSVGEMVRRVVVAGRRLGDGKRPVSRQQMCCAPAADAVMCS